MEAQVKALQKEAFTTQRTLQQLQSREAPGPFSALPEMDFAMFGTVALLFGALLAMWWYLWQRPQTRLAQQNRVATKDSRHLSEFAGAPHPEPERRPHVAQPPVVPVDVAPVYEPKPTPAPERKPAPNPKPVVRLPPTDIEPPVTPVPTTGLFARREPSVGFDSEAAANEVTRVRKSLAEKREARAMLREYEEESQAPADDNPTLQASLSNSLQREAPVAALPPEPPEPPEPLTAAQETMSQPTVEEPELAPMVSVESTETQDAVEIDETHTSHAPSCAVTLALAQESFALELWPEARELACEAVEFGDASVRNEAQALLQRIEVHEEQMRREAEAIHNDATDSVVRTASGSA